MEKILDPEIWGSIIVFAIALYTNLRARRAKLAEEKARESEKQASNAAKKALGAASSIEGVADSTEEFKLLTKELQSNIRQLNTKIEAMEVSNHFLKEDYERAIELLDQVQEERTSMLAEIKNLEGRIQELEKRLDDEVSTNRILKLENDDLRGQILQYKNANRTLAIRNEDLEKEVAALRLELDSIKAKLNRAGISEF